MPFWRVTTHLRQCLVFLSFNVARCGWNCLTPFKENLNEWLSGWIFDSWKPCHDWFVISHIDCLLSFWSFSRAILAYLVNKYGKDDQIYPKDPQKRAVVDRMLYFDIGTLYKSMVDYFVSRLAHATNFELFLSTVSTVVVLLIFFNRNVQHEPIEAHFFSPILQGAACRYR